ncbi:MAG TPA: HEPN domain-containing protein [Anaerolineae bacterium]|nr:HEPN domain-containing protein [Anaerolineae bacterium]
MSVHPSEEWVEKAEDNYVSAVALARHRNRPVPDIVCNQCQQCAEKYLKALLIRRRIDFPKTHDLIQLKNLLTPADADVQLMTDRLAVLTPYAIDGRYPGLEATVEDAREAVNAMKEMRKFARAKLGLR